MRTLDRAVGKWANILISLGVPSHVVSGKHQQCPICGNGKDTFRFDRRSEIGNWFCGYCPTDRKIGIDFVMCFFRVEMKEALDMLDKVLGVGVQDVRSKKRDPRPLLRSIFRKMGRPKNDVLDYLHSRGLQPTEAIKQARLNYWHDGIDYGEYEAMCSLIHDVNGKAQSVHVTYLKDGKKADLPVVKKVMTPIDTTTGGAIRLMNHRGEIGIAEGIETALSASILYGIPVWATISANGMDKFQVPKGISRVEIFSDNDDNFVGQFSAYSLAKRLISEGINAKVHIPKLRDFNDILKI